MNKKLLVMLVSEQTIPNVQFLKWYFKENLQTVDVLYFSTNKMEKREKTKMIRNSLDYLEKYIKKTEIICVNENSIEDFNVKTQKLLDENKYDSFVVNITGGTKIMSLAAYNFFKEQNNCEIFYQPINEPLQRIFPTFEEFSVSELLTLKEYMDAHGIIYKYNNYCVKDYDFNKNVYKNIIEKNRETIKDILAIQNTSYFKNIYKRKDFVDFANMPDEKFVTPENKPLNKDKICKVIEAFDFDITAVPKSCFRYITGGWFEEFVFQKIKNELNIADNNIALNVYMQKENDNNELDVVYIADNRLHVIECKSFLDGKEGDKILNEALYKLQAIMKSKFGLNAVPALYTQSIIEKESVLNRAKEFRIAIVDGSKL